MVTFDGYGNTGVTTLGLLKVSSMGFSSSAARENRREQKEKEKEYQEKEGKEKGTVSKNGKGAGAGKEQVAEFFKQSFWQERLC